MPKPKIDRRVRKLVAAMNSLPGVRTYSSCGGHKNPDPSQIPAGRFQVSFDVKENRDGWRALSRLADAADAELQTTGHAPNITIWWNGGSLSFDMTGTGSPDAFAGRLRPKPKRRPR